jgi:hypothetical protein
MKKVFAILAAGGIMTAATVQAQVDIYITGSTAFRANAYNSIIALYGANLTSQNPSPAGSKNMVTFQGTIPGTFGSQTVTIRTSFSGSAAGVQSLTQNNNLNFLSSASNGDTNLVSHQADLAFSDVFQATTAFLAPTLVDTNVGIQPFAYVKSSQTPATVTNITIQQLQTFLPNGILTADSFTGNTNDTGTLVYLVGRDSSSGTRLTAERDSLFIGSELNWQTNGVTCNSWAPSPGGSSGGFSSGSGVAGQLNSGCGAAIGYLGLADAANVNGGANIIAYNGYKPNVGTVGSPDFSPVLNGLYSFWGYEHLFNRSGAPANVVTFKSVFVNAINNDLGTSITAIQVGKMKVVRPSDGGPISPP